MDIIQARIERNKHCPKELMRTASGKYNDFLEDVHQNFSKLIPKVTKEGEQFIDYWPVFVLINPRITSKIFNGTSYREMTGQKGAGYLLLTDRKVRLILSWAYSKKYSPLKDSLGTTFLIRLLGGEGIDYLINPIKEDLVLEQDLSDLKIGTIKNKFGVDSLEVHFQGKSFELVGIIENSLSDLYQCLYSAFRSTLSNSVPVEKMVKQKLLELQDLKNSGLITEEEYNRKRQQILNHL